MTPAGELLPVCILAGGRGTRLGVEDRPKPLVEVAGEPFLVHPLRRLKAAGARRVVISVGFLGDQFETVLGDGSQLGLELEYVADGAEPLGTAGAVRKCLPSLGDAFLVMYGDTILTVDFGDLQAQLLAGDRLGVLTVLRNEGRWDTSNTKVEDGFVVSHDKQAPAADMEWIDYGLAALRAQALDAAPAASDLSLVYGELAANGELAAYEVTERFYEIGTQEARSETERFLERGRARDPLVGKLRARLKR